jgi:hypothetical protein
MYKESKSSEVSQSISERKLAIDALRLRSVSVSHGTHRTQDLIPCFMDYIYKYNYDAWTTIIHDIKLSWENSTNPIDGSVTFSEMMIDVVGLDGYRYGLSLDDDDLWWDTEDASTILNEDIWQAMDQIAPPGTSFGAHEGDGSDFGFWEQEDSDESL